MKGDRHKMPYALIQFISNVQNKQVHRGRKGIGQGRNAKGNSFLFGGHKNILKLDDGCKSQEFIINHWFVHFKRMNSMAHEFIPQFKVKIIVKDQYKLNQNQVSPKWTYDIHG